MKLRKMLCTDLNDVRLQELMRLIETQSKQTIVRWCIFYARKNYLPLCSDAALEKCLQAAEDWLEGKIKLPEAKKLILNCHEVARKLEGNPAKQAAVRAVGQGASSIHVATHALGIVFYGTAAFAYNEVCQSTNEICNDTIDKLASEEFDRILKSFKSVCVKNEKDPVKVKWNC